MFEELENMLKDGNPECLAFTEKLRQIPGSEKLIQQIEDFDFTLAADTLIELKRSVKSENSGF